MANTLTNQYAEIFAAFDMVAREPLGFIPAVYHNSSREAMAVNTTQTIRYPIVPTAVTATITASMTLPSGDAQTIGSGTMKVTNAQSVQIPWDGEEQKGLANTGTLNPILRDQYAQAFRVLSNKIEADLAGLYPYASRAYGALGTTPFASSVESINQCRKIVRDNGSPDMDLQCVIDTSAGVNLGKLTQVIASSYGDTADNQVFTSGKFRPMFGVNIYESGQVQSVASSSSSTSLAATEAVGSTALTVDDAAGFVAGEICVIEGDARKYVAQTTATGTITLNSPGAIAAAATNQDVTAGTTTYTANMLFNRNAIHLVTRPPAIPVGGDASSVYEIVTDPNSGISYSLTVYKGYKMNVTEVGLVWGVKAVKSDFISILVG